MEKSLGGDRLGSGNKIKVQLHNYERSTHDLSKVWRSTMAVGTLVPFFREIALNGDTWEMDIASKIRTYPTTGPLFGSLKLQLDVFQCPIRLYQAMLHNNMLGIGMNMEQVKLPQVEISCNKIDFNSDEPIDVQQINPSALLAYLGIRGIGQGFTEDSTVTSLKNGIPMLAYWDIYKNYYANKQEPNGKVISAKVEVNKNLKRIALLNASMQVIGYNAPEVEVVYDLNKTKYIKLEGEQLSLKNAQVKRSSDPNYIFIKDQIWLTPIDEAADGSYLVYAFNTSAQTLTMAFRSYGGIETGEIEILDFPLSNIDEMRETILAARKDQVTIDQSALEPYVTSINQTAGGRSYSYFSQVGLGIKTYQSDIFNNWLSTEWIDGDNGISAITAIDTSKGSFTIDALNLANKVYNMLNRIAVSGGTYEDWQEAVYGEEAIRKAESPIYMGGASTTIVFDEVVSTAESETLNGENPLGTLAGRGRQKDEQKGGKIKIKVREPSYIIGIVSITPMIDYSQGNKWDTRLRTMNDLHKPALDGIGFQELITEQMAAWNCVKEADGTEKLFSAGKQPAWINYMTNYNECYGNFADPRKEMFMTFNRQYESDSMGNIKDLTTYIDPTKYNYAFALQKLDAQNFWVQVGVNATARRKMSAKVIPNL